MIDFKKHFNSKKRVSYQNLKSKKLYQNINNFFCKILNKKINFTNLKDLEKLKIEDIKKIDFNVREKYQKRFVKIIYPEIKQTVNFFFEKNISIRVSCQAKFKWNKNYNKKKLYNRTVKKLDQYSSILSDDLYYKPTPAHQDLSHNGFRSSSVIIFYFQITPLSDESSLLSIPQNYKELKILPTFVTKDNYPNAIKLDIVKKLKFKKIFERKKNKMLIFDGFTPHSSTEISKIPRIALNVKIQPTSLNYVYKIYKIKKKFKKNISFKKNMEILENDLKFAIKKNKGLLFELAVLNCLQGKIIDMKKNLIKLFYQKPTDDILQKYIAGGLSRKTLENITKNDIKNIYRKNPYIEKLSCAEAITNTINENFN